MSTVERRTGRREAAETALKSPGDVRPCWTRAVPVYSEVEKENIHIEIVEVADDSGFLAMRMPTVWTALLLCVMFLKHSELK